jgi:2-polyprenyl-6-methoxyphenol hydroxylase-like FAD-dependent oxidoreductase
MEIRTEVLIIGGGPAGLSTAIELGMRGVRVLLIERNLRSGAAARAKTTNVRTRTHLRRWGVADRLAEASPLGIDYPNDVIFTTRLAGYELAHFEDAFNARPERSAFYPEHAQWIPQYTLEQVLLEHLRTLPSVDVRFGVTLVDAEQDDAGVTARVQTQAGEQSLVFAAYLIGADGARSAVRSLIGARMDGHYGLSRNYNIVFRAPGLAAAHPHRRAVMYWQANADGGSLVGPMDSDDVWFFMPTGMKEGETLSNAEAAAAIARSTGIDVPYEILSTDEWVASDLIADRYRDRRMFLAGDACHLHPPFGGYGMNMGVGDGADLGWKLAAVLQGWGGPALLDSYEAERRPVALTVIAEAVKNHAVLGGEIWRPGLEDDTPEGERLRAETGAAIFAAKDREFHSLGIILGLRYESSPVIVYEQNEASSSPTQFYHPSAQPGSLAPHAWLADGRSLYDLFGPGFALVASDDADETQIDAAISNAHTLDTPLTIVRAPDVPIANLYASDLTLVRPDQYVAWRGSTWSMSVLRQATGLSEVSA